MIYSLWTQTLGEANEPAPNGVIDYVASKGHRTEHSPAGVTCWVEPRFLFTTF